METSQILKARARAAELQAKTEAALQRAYHDSEGRHGSSHSLPHAQNLRAIRTALLHLQGQLESLQALQKRQKIEKEDVLVELEERRNLLIQRLREYKGTEWEIVEEAHAFAGQPVQREDDLILPPRQSSSRDVQPLRERCNSGGLSRQQQCRIPEEEDKQKQSKVVLTSKKAASNSTDSSGFVFNMCKLALRAGALVLVSAKSAVVIASIMFTLSQLEPQLKKWSTDRSSNTGFRLYGFGHSGNRLSSSTSALNRSVVEPEFCPPGKALLLQDGIQKCFVKERTEAQCKVIKQPDATYGCG